MHDGADTSLAEEVLSFVRHPAQDAAKTELMEAELMCANAYIVSVKTNRAAAVELHIHAQRAQRWAGESWG